MAEISIEEQEQRLESALAELRRTPQQRGNHMIKMVDWWWECINCGASALNKCEMPLDEPCE